MVDTLPAMIDPARLADKGARIAGHLSLQALPRVRAICVDDGAGVDVDMEFGRDADGRRYMHARLSTVLPLQCQRCLGALTTPIDVDNSVLLLVPGEVEADLPAETEWMRADAAMSLKELVEDELLLALPMMPMHEDTGCAGIEMPTGDGLRANPFAVLNKLKRQDR